MAPDDPFEVDYEKIAFYDMLVENVKNGTETRMSNLMSLIRTLRTKADLYISMRNLTRSRRTGSVENSRNNLTTQRNDFTTPRLNKPSGLRAQRI